MLASMRPQKLIRNVLLAALAVNAACDSQSTEPALKPSGAGPATTQIASGAVHSCLLGTSGNVVCWGRYGSDPSAPWIAAPPTLVTPVDGSVRFTSITAGASTCGLTAEGVAYCWGSNLYGQLGDGTTIARADIKPVSTALRFLSLESGVLTTCGIATTGSAYCWGRGDYATLGGGVLPEGTKQLTPIPVSGNLKYRSLSGGLNFCGITDTQATYCWGIGPGSFDEAPFVAQGDCAAVYYVFFSGKGCAVPTPVASPSTFATLSNGNNGLSMCGLESGGTVRCWGEGWLGTLGNNQAGSGVHAIQPVLATSSQVFKQVSSANTHVCALSVDGAAYCWGNNFRGYLGTGSTIGGSAVPLAVAGGHRFVSISAGDYHTCGLKANNEVWCWGAGTEGQLGQPGSLADSNVPIRVDLSAAPAI